MRRARLISFLLLSIEASRVSAQVQLTVDAGASRLHQSGFPVAGAATVGAAAEWLGDRAFVHSSILGARSGGDRTTGQWLVVGSAASPAWRAFQLQATGSASVFGQTTLAPTTSADILGELRAANASAGASIGGGAGSTSHNAVSIPVVRGVAGAWWTHGVDRLSVDASMTRTRSLFGEASILVDVSTTAVNYVDAGGTWLHDPGSWSLAVSAGVRNQNAVFQGGSSAAEWHSVDVAAWIAPHAAIAASIGRTLEDLVRGVPRTGYATIGMRLSMQPHLSILRRPVEINGPRLLVSRGDGDARRLDVVAAAMSRVELMADFTDWNPVPLVRTGSAWRLERAVAPGPHRIAIRVDGGEWIVPANLPKLADDLGGTVGLITVP